MGKIIENNQAEITGTIESGFLYSHKIFGERFYLMDVSVKRGSGVCDIIPVMISERLIDVTQDYEGESIQIFGQFRSYNRHEEKKNRVVLLVFAQEARFVAEEYNKLKSNHIFLDGYICKTPVYRKTPLGREISDIILAVNRPHGKSDYIPCVCWGRNARYTTTLGVGSHVMMSGRIQSREYQKKVQDSKTETRVAYEVSVSEMEVEK